MKFEKNVKYNTFALLAVLVVAFATLLISFAMHFEGIRGVFARILGVLAPLIYALILVLILLPIIDFFEVKFRHLLKKYKNYRKKAAVLALVCAYLLLFGVVGLSVFIIVSQSVTLYDFALNFVDEYLPVLTKVVTDISAEWESVGEILMNSLDSLKSVFTDSLANLPDVALAIVSAFGDFISVLSDWLIAVIISIYALLRRKKLKAMLRKINAALFTEKNSHHISDMCNALYRNSVAFFSARAYNLVIVGIASYAIFFVMGLRFYSVIALIIAVCSIVPVIGMLLGGGIGAFIVLATDTPKTVMFLITFLVIYLLDYLLVRPRVTNPRVAVSIGTSVFCVLVGFFVWKILGALFAIPIYITVRDTVIKWYKLKKEEKQKIKNSAEG